jgi:(S)-ureidoglycine aminohydrolase
LAAEKKPPYYAPVGGLPPQDRLVTGKSHFTEAYAVIGKDAQQDITASYLPGWQATRLWVLARPMTGFAETFSHYLMEVASQGGSDTPEEEMTAEAVLFVVSGTAELILEGETYQLVAGSYVYIAPAARWSLQNRSAAPCCFHWIRKIWQPAAGLDKPESFVTSDAATAPLAMPDTDGCWSTSRFVDPADMRHDMHINIVNFEPGGLIPFAETHVMEHGLYILQGSGVYYLNGDWVAVEAGDFLWLRAFCPQACYASGTGPFRYLLYKDVNRHMPLKAAAAPTG